MTKWKWHQKRIWRWRLGCSCGKPCWWGDWRDWRRYYCWDCRRRSRL